MLRESKLFYFPAVSTSLGTLPSHYVEAFGPQEARDAVKHGGKDVTYDAGAWREYDAEYTD